MICVVCCKSNVQRAQCPLHSTKPRRILSKAPLEIGLPQSRQPNRHIDIVVSCGGWYLFPSFTDSCVAIGDSPTLRGPHSPASVYNHRSSRSHVRSLLESHPIPTRFVFVTVGGLNRRRRRHRRRILTPPKSEARSLYLCVFYPLPCAPCKPGTISVLYIIYSKTQRARARVPFSA